MLTALIPILMAALGFPALFGCGAGKGLSDITTNPDGKPIVSGEICVNTGQGRFCYMPNKPTIVEPEPKPENMDAAAVAAPTPVVAARTGVFPDVPLVVKTTEN